MSKRLKINEREKNQWDNIEEEAGRTQVGSGAG